ncbi:MAG: hypothetical protein ACD_61C00138G0001 [uncultured bacterium]|nr:MAG: hypothetical protein ACD_61C00138G0001 [uncultured bacterium]
MKTKMKKQNKKTLISALLLLIGLVVIFGVAVLIKTGNFSDQSRASTNVMLGKLIKATDRALCIKCVEQCPGRDNVLRSCNPMASYGISIDSMCNKAGRVETCGGKTFCCPAPNSRWTTDMTKCSGVTPPAKPNSNYLLLKPGGVCTALVVSKTLADPLLNKQVVATGTLKEPYFYASQLVEDKPGCDTTQRDTPVTTKLKFPRTGKVAIFSMSPVQFRATVKLVGPRNFNIDLVPNVSPAKADRTFDVIAGEQYALSMVVKYPNNTNKPAVGWIPPAEVGKCGPKKSPGKDKCGVLWDISKLIEYAKANSSGITGIKAGVNEANVGCWADPKTNNPLEDYDFNDWAIVFGYVGSQPTITTTSTPTIAPPTRPPTPTPTKEPTPTSFENQFPRINTNSLPTGTVNQSYSASIDATDDTGDQLRMTISGLPFGLNTGPCAIPVGGGQITCNISGTPASAGDYSVNVVVTDNHGGRSNKVIPLTIVEIAPAL